LEISLPKETAGLTIAQEQKAEIKPVARMPITGVIRDDAGIPIDGIYMKILPPPSGWLLRKYPEGRFEAYQLTKRSEASIRKYHFMARHLQRNLVAFVEFNEDVNDLDVRLEPGAILAGKVVDPYDKGIQDTKITTILQAFDSRVVLLPAIVKPDAEGKFEIRALPLGHKYIVGVRAMGYRMRKIEVSSINAPDNRIDPGPIVLARGQFSVSGVVVDKKGKPVANAWIYCSGENQVGINSRTDAKGKFIAHGIFEGPVLIYSAIQGDSPGEASYGQRHSRAGATNVKIVLKYKSTYGKP